MHAVSYFHTLAAPDNQLVVTWANGKKKQLYPGVFIAWYVEDF